jgi:hypothetical protein
VEISIPIIWAISVICKNQPEVNSHPIGENSPNMVTLLRSQDVRNAWSLLTIWPAQTFRGFFAVTLTRHHFSIFGATQSAIFMRTIVVAVTSGLPDDTKTGEKCT